MNRRSLLAGILAAGFAPAAVSSGILMPVRRISDGLVLGRITMGGRIVYGKQPMQFWTDLASGPDQAVSALLERVPGEWIPVEITWLADDPCRIPAEMSFSDFHLGQPFHLSSRKVP